MAVLHSFEKDTSTEEIHQAFTIIRVHVVFITLVYQSSEEEMASTTWGRCPIGATSNVHVRARQSLRC